MWEISFFNIEGLFREITAVSRLRNIQLTIKLVAGDSLLSINLMPLCLPQTNASLPCGFWRGRWLL
jgi:hypothetical protein